MEGEKVWLIEFSGRKSVYLKILLYLSKMLTTISAIVLYVYFPNV